MSVEDILKEKNKKEGNKNLRYNPDILRQRQSQSLQQNRQGQRPKRTTNRSLNKYIMTSQSIRERLGRDLTKAEKAGMFIGTTAKTLLDFTTRNLKMLGMGALALTTLIGYLKEKHTYDISGYSNVERFMGQEPGVQGGFSALKGSGRSTGRLSEKGKQFIANEEGLRTKAYKDSKGIWTIGVGHTGKVDGKSVGPGMEITKEKAMELFTQDVAKFENYVNKVVKVPVTQNMFDAMVSYSFNVGSLGPKFLKKLNSGDYRGALAELDTIDKELVGRNKRQRELFGRDISADNKIIGEEINKPVKTEQIVQTSAGKRTRYQTGGTTSSSNPKIGNYQLWNPNTKRGYIELSDRATKYLEETGGTGIITSGSEGSHASGTVSHGAGNKIDVVAYGSKDEDWANCAIPFIRNKNTAFINFEDFSTERFNRIKKIIYSKISQDLINKCERTQKWLNSAKPQPFLTHVYIGHGLHLDIGILPNAYDPKTQATQTKTNETKEIPTKQKPQKQNTKQPQVVKDKNVTVIRAPQTTPPQPQTTSLDKPNWINSKYQQLNTQRKNRKS